LAWFSPRTCHLGGNACEKSNDVGDAKGGVMDYQNPACPPWWYWHPNTGWWWDARMHRFITQEGYWVEPLHLQLPTSEDERARTHLDWDIAAAMQREGARRCQLAMEEVILDSLEPPVWPTREE
jgi:hypothetical protein